MDPVPFNPIGYGVALILGYFLKRNPNINNQAIPVINFAIQFLGLLLLQVQPAEAGVFGFLGKVGEGVLPLALEAVVNTVAAAGTQSGAKATGRVAWKFLKNSLIIKLIEKAAGEVKE